MDIRTAIKIIAGVITPDNVDWYDTGYDTYKFSALGKPDWADVKAKAADVLADALYDLSDKLNEQAQG